jgi:hypothetical protein
MHLFPSTKSSTASVSVQVSIEKGSIEKGINQLESVYRGYSGCDEREAFGFIEDCMRILRFVLTIQVCG